MSRWHHLDNWKSSGALTESTSSALSAPHKMKVFGEEAGDRPIRVLLGLVNLIGHSSIAAAVVEANLPN